MVTVKKVNRQNLCDDLMVENLKQARRIAALEAMVASLRINQQRKGKIIAFDSLERTVTVELYSGCDGLVMGATAAITSPIA
jgi:hypothetical protein